MDFRWPPPPDGRPDRYRPPVTRGPQTGRPTPPQPVTELIATPLEAVDTGDAATVADVISQEAPPQLRNSPAVWSFLRQRLDQLMRDGLAAGLASLPEQIAVTDRAALAAVTAPALVIACRGD